MQWVAERELIFGLHVHVGLSTADEAIAVANALRTWLPELLALSANSPFWQGRDTGLASTRSKVFDAFPRSGLPPAFSSSRSSSCSSTAASEGLGSFDDYTYIWWDLRPIRSSGRSRSGSATRRRGSRASPAIVALVQASSPRSSDRYEREGALPIQPVTLIAENKWRAARYGLDADLVDLERDKERPAREAMLALVELAAPARAAARLRRTSSPEVERLCSTAAPARTSSGGLRGDGSLLAVAQWLAEQTVAEV